MEKTAESLNQGEKNPRNAKRSEKMEKTAEEKTEEGSKPLTDEEIAALLEEEFRREKKEFKKPSIFKKIAHAINRREEKPKKPKQKELNHKKLEQMKDKAKKQMIKEEKLKERISETRKNEIDALMKLLQKKKKMWEKKSAFHFLRKLIFWRKKEKPKIELRESFDQLKEDIAEKEKRIKELRAKEEEKKRKQNEIAEHIVELRQAIQSVAPVEPKKKRRKRKRRAAKPRKRRKKKAVVKEKIVKAEKPSKARKKRAVRIPRKKKIKPKEKPAVVTAVKEPRKAKAIKIIKRIEGTALPPEAVKAAVPSPEETLESIAEEKEEIKEKRRHLRIAYLKRRIGEEAFKSKMYSLSERTHMLKLKEKKLKEKPGEPKEAVVEEKKEKAEPPAIEAEKKPTERAAVKEIKPAEVPKKPVVKEMKPPEVPKAVALEKSGKAIPVTKPAPPKRAPFKPVSGKEKKQFDQILEEKARGRFSEEKMKEMKQKVKNAVEEYGVPAKKMQKNLEGLDANKLLQDFDKLLGLIKAERGAKAVVREKPAEIFGEIPTGKARKAKPPLAIEKEIEKTRIVTDFDRLLALIRKKGAIKLSQARKELNVSKKKLKEAYQVLEENDLLEVRYPVIGEASLVFKGSSLEGEISQMKLKKNKVEKK